MRQTVREKDLDRQTNWDRQKEWDRESESNQKDKKSNTGIKSTRQTESKHIYLSVIVCAHLYYGLAS